MNYPLREHLQAYTDSTGSWIRCTKCLHVLCPLGEDWKRSCKKGLFPPTKAGPLMSVLLGRYLLQKLYCPSCGTLFDSAMVEHPDHPGRKHPNE
ncbi:MAG: hypothetical protein A2038_04695 [Deltaproteobacteria bacterium GWA2_57_13]|nr:MAG: hypothetical protein A2038_04695 [Deltaproteobacteria bacterium GWA2_57_13]OGQ85079.1 MAG: hypothetical protein A3G40_14315 [Deltaproteobacteria bacterium RIFCSPLOWO2_12_FULL_57_22]